MGWYADGSMNQLRKLFLLVAGVASLSLVGGGAQMKTPAARTKPPVGFERVIELWPGGAPGAVGEEEEDIPKLWVYPAQKAVPGARSAVIVMPGGGYRTLVTEKEGGAAARWLAAHGVTAFVLQYRLGPRYHFPAPMDDGARAVRYVRSHAGEFGVDKNKIGIWGFSAGAHLAGYLGSVNDGGDKGAADAVKRVSDRPDFLVLSYGRLSLEESIPRKTNLEGLLGDHPTAEQLRSVSIDRLVTKATVPSFVYSTTADQTVDSRNATAYYDAMKAAGAPVELHIFERGSHGTGMGQKLKGLDELGIYPTLVADWMEMHGWMAEGR